MAMAMAATNATTMTCPTPMKATSNGSWQGDNPLDYALPLAILQICLVVALTRTLAFILRPLRQPRVIAEIIGGIILGPSALGRSTAFLNAVFPKQSLTVLDTLANIGLLFFLFLVGLELDLQSIRRTGKRALAIALAGISLPFIMGIGTSFVLRSTVSRGVREGPFLVFMGVALSITAFPVLARILAELKLLTTELGRMAMSAAAVNDVAAWILLALAIALSGSGSPLVSLWVLLTGAGFVVFVAVAVRPVLNWMARRSPDGEPVKEVYICATLATVLAAGFVTDTIGIHALFGAFVVGIVVPKDGPFAGILIEKVEDLISGLFLPLYFVSSGLKTNVATISSGQSWGLLALVITTACVGKVGGTVLVALAAKIPPREAITLGFLMNTKGLVELIVLNIGKDRKVLNDESFAILVLMALFTTFITTPIVTGIYKPARRAAPYKHRSISCSAESASELRVLACFHGSRNIPTMINLVESSRGTRRRGIVVYAMHLMELSERSSAISMVHKARRNGLPFWNNKRHQSEEDQIVVAFQAYQQLSHVTIRSMTAISDLHTIHEDVVTSAQQKRVALILLPFHKLQRIDGSMESLGHDYQHVNQRVLRHAPCSVGILVDRGLGGASQVSSSDVSYSVAVLFFGGRDDREALAYSTRIAEHPGIALTVLRFVFSNVNIGSNSVRIAIDDNDASADEAALAEFKSKVAAASDGSIKYEEKVVNGKAEIVAAVKEVGRSNLFLVGQMPPCMALSADVRDCPELGPVGSYLAASEFSTTASVLVVKQFDPTVERSKLVEEVGESYDLPDTPIAVAPEPDLVESHH
ncbi:cation/H(+) antiporter 19-like [Typha latifolia]|uniref:cation/H(+) antiporter 19-like n=1 Tax=Typha latifolia TaxID=4733 RepID=UPI003C2ADADF